MKQTKYLAAIALTALTLGCSNNEKPISRELTEHLRQVGRQETFFDCYTAINPDLNQVRDEFVRECSFNGTSGDLMSIVNKRKGLYQSGRVTCPPQPSWYCLSGGITVTNPNVEPGFCVDAFVFSAVPNGPDKGRVQYLSSGNPGIPKKVCKDGNVSY